MAVANVAWVLALNGYRVLVIDWDLEAPGIHRYFHPFLEDKELETTQGLLDMVEHLAAQAATSSAPLSEESVDIINYIEPLEWPTKMTRALSWKAFGPRARIDFMPAGRQGPAYSRTLNTFNWIDFYERLGGRRLLEIAKTQMRSIYDYVLIDSRTGVSDTSGICTVEMPDVLVICFTLNDQSIRGAAAVAMSVRNQRARLARTSDPNSPLGRTDKDALRIFPVPARVEITSERDKREAALDIARETFSPFLSDLTPTAQSEYWGGVQLGYFPFYAFEEIPAIFGDKRDDLLSLTTAIKRITRAITDPPIDDVPPLAPEVSSAEVVRKEIVTWYLRRSKESGDHIARLAQDIFDTCDKEGKAEMLRVLLRLVVVSQDTPPSPKNTPINDLNGSSRKMQQLLIERRLLTIDGTGATQSVAISDPTLIERWKPLREQIEADRNFLNWRLRLGASVESWRRSGEDPAALLRGTLLGEAADVARDRAQDLNSEELRYIEASARAAARARSMTPVEMPENRNAPRELGYDKTTERERLERERWRARSYRLIAASFIIVVAMMFAIQFWFVRTRERDREQFRELTAEMRQLSVENQVLRAKLGVSPSGSPEDGTTTTLPEPPLGGSTLEPPSRIPPTKAPSKLGNPG
jgi:cellulose biosynthesis protein BcsQ